MSTITFRTKRQADLFEHELKGQLSDGHWENSSPRGHWEPWARAAVTHGENIGRDFSAQKKAYTLHNKDLVDCVGSRMLIIAILSDAGYSKELITLFESSVNCDSEVALNPELPTCGGEYWENQRKLMEPHIVAVRFDVAASTYTLKDLRKDLREMSKTMKIRHADQPIKKVTPKKAKPIKITITSEDKQALQLGTLTKIKHLMKVNDYSNERKCQFIDEALNELETILSK